MTVIELSFYFAASVFLFINFFLYIKWAKDEPSKAFEIGENGKVFINELKPEKDSRKDNIKAESISRNNQSKMVEKNNLYIREIKRKKYWHSLNEEKTKNIFKNIFGSLGYIVKYPETFNEKDFDLILDDEIVVRINCKKRQVRALEVEKFWKCWKDTKYKGIYVSIYGFGSNSTYLELGKQILLFKLEDVIKMAEGKKPYLRMPENYGKEVKEVENSVSYDRKPEFKGEQPPSQYESYRILLKLLPKDSISVSFRFLFTGTASSNP